MAACLQASLLVRFAPPAVADAFCATRLGGDYNGTLGTLPGRHGPALDRRPDHPRPPVGAVPRRADTSFERTGSHARARGFPDMCPRVAGLGGPVDRRSDRIGVGARVATCPWSPPSSSSREDLHAAEAMAASSRRRSTGLRRGDIVWFSRGRYGLPELDRDTAVAHGLNAVLSHLSAALWHGWEVKTMPEETHITIPRRRQEYALQRAVAHRATCVQTRCRTASAHPSTDAHGLPARSPVDDALAVGDSALRHGVPRAVLRRISGTVRGPGRPGEARLQRGDARAANPFESCLRAIAHRVDGLEVEPQQWIRNSARPCVLTSWTSDSRWCSKRSPSSGTAAGKP